MLKKPHLGGFLGSMVVIIYMRGDDFFDIVRVTQCAIKAY